MAVFSTFASVEQLNQQFSQMIAERLRSAIAQKGNASLVVSGGKTPQALFQQLSQQPLAWSKVIITLADERWVPNDNEASNERMVRDTLLQNKAAEAQFIALKNESITAAEGVKQTEARLNAIMKPFDVVILGMGDDGHTASLFPGATNLTAALAMDSGKLCAEMTPLTAPLDRMTLTLPALLSSQQIYLHIIGENKKAVYQQAMQGTAVNEMPIRAILQQTKIPVEVIWAA